MAEERKDVKDEIMKDYTRDMRYSSRTSNLVILALILALALMVVGTVIIVLSSQRSQERLAKHNAELMINFLSQYDFETEIDVDTHHNFLNAGNVNINTK